MAIESRLTKYNNLGTLLDTIDLSKLPAPTDLVAVPGVGQVNLSWSVVPGATNYTLYYGSKDGGPYPTRQAAPTNTAQVTGLVGGTPYYFVVTANDTNGPSAASLQAAAMPTAQPLAITSLMRQSDGSLSLAGSAAAAQTCILLTSPTLNPPVVWVPVATNAANLNGSFTFSVPLAPDSPQGFYRIQAR